MRQNLFAAALFVSLATGLSAGSKTVAAQENEATTAASVTDPAFQKECSACHMAFPAGMLPAASWTAIMAGLKDHFGENASLDAATVARIEAFLVENAAPAGANGERLFGVVDPAKPPLRITETRWWTRVHSDEVRPEAFSNPKVGSKANCTACHAGAASGRFEDD